VGDRGTVLTTGDGGASWIPRKSYMTSFLFGVALAADGRRGIAVGDRGTVLTTGDGGASWIPRTRKTGLRLVGVALAADGRRGIAVGDRGAVLTTGNSGSTWTRRKSRTTSFLYGVALAADGRRGIAVGDRGTVLTTADGGVSWMYVRKAVAAKRKLVLAEKSFFLNERERLVRENRELETGRATRPSDKGKDTGMDDGSEKDRWDDLMTTASWRLSVLGLALFIIWILARLNRYNRRLAAFYFARADLLLMLRAEPDSVPLDVVERLMSMLAPDHLDFGRRPKAVARHAMGSARK
jgi:hypothetical protein